MHTTGKFFVKTCLTANRDTFFPNMCDFPICDIFIQQKGKVYTFRLAGIPPPPTFPSSLRKTLKVVGQLTVMIFFQSKKFTACKVKDEKDEAVFK